MSALTDVSWVAVVVASIVSFVLGSVWYSPVMFVEKWKQGIGISAVKDRKLAPLMVIQFIATVLFTWSVIAAAPFSMALAILIVLGATGMIKANGFFAGKTFYAIAVESSYIVVQGAFAIIAYQIFK